MKILKRYKDKYGNVTAYDVLYKGKVSTQDAESVKQMRHLIDNATMLKSGLFKAKSGYTIETVSPITTTDLTIGEKTNLSVGNKFGFNDTDYFGKGMILACRRIRNCAYNNNIILDESEHKSNEGRNTHFFNLIRACGIEPKDFVRGYLSRLQPYCLEYWKKEKAGEQHIWVCDIGYDVKLLIKVNHVDSNGPVIISFHESNLLGVNRKVKGTDFMEKPCAVFVDKVKSNDTHCRVKYIVQKGFVVYKFSSTILKNKYKDGVALVEYKDISEEFSDFVKSTINTLYNIYNENDLYDKVPMLKLNQIGFMSFGYTDINNLCMCIDMFKVYHDTQSRLVISNLAEGILKELTYTRQLEVKQALESKYEGSNNALYDMIKNL